VFPTIIDDTNVEDIDVVFGMRFELQLVI